MPLTTALPSEADGGEVKRRLRGIGAGSSDPLDRHRLAGERRLVDKDVLRRDQPKVEGIMSPADRRTISPGTSCSIGTSTWSCASAPTCRPMVAVISTICRRLSAASLERCSWIMPSEMLQNHHDGDHDRGPRIAQEVGRGRKREQERVQRVDRAADQLPRIKWRAWRATWLRPAPRSRALASLGADA